MFWFICHGKARARSSDTPMGTLALRHGGHPSQSEFGTQVLDGNGTNVVMLPTAMMEDQVNAIRRSNGAAASELRSNGGIQLQRQGTVCSEVM